MRRIQQLPVELSNQIAAGEVIERPASVVKELLENAIDARSTLIQIELDYGGLNRIKISDNGQGIEAEDLPLAIAAHATSKLRSLNDLYQIQSLGFRGEALASIASVARLQLTSKPASQAHAMRLEYSERGLAINPAARSQGTTVEVRDLFYNAPVRKKFLKSERSEFLAIEQLVKRIAMSQPQIAFSLKHNDKSLLELPAVQDPASERLRVQKLLGKTFLDHAVFFTVCIDDLKLRAWVSDLDFDRSQNDKLWVYVNGRMVRDKLVLHAIKQAYDGCLHPGRHPACLLYLDLPADQLDVNVHPTKHELRFQQPRLVHDFISSQIVKALQASAAEPKRIVPLTESPLPWKTTTAKPVLNLREVTSSYIKPLEMSAAAGLWQPLDARFLLISVNNRYYLLDFPEIQKSRLRERMQAEPTACQARPLLVPLRVTIQASEQDAFERLQGPLAEFGLEFDFAAQNLLILRSIPSLMPNLLLADFVKALQALLQQNQSPTRMDLLLLLLNSQSYDAAQIIAEERRLILELLEQPAIKGIKALDQKSWERLFHA